MNTIFSYETARISVETMKGMTPTGINTFFISSHGNFPM